MTDVSSHSCQRRRGEALGEEGAQGERAEGPALGPGTPLLLGRAGPGPDPFPFEVSTGAKLLLVTYCRRSFAGGSVFFAASCAEGERGLTKR